MSRKQGPDQLKWQLIFILKSSPMYIAVLRLCFMVKGLGRHSKCACWTCSIGLDTEIQSIFLVCFRREHARACYCVHIHFVCAKAASRESIRAFVAQKRDNTRRHLSRFHNYIEFVACGGIKREHAWLSSMGAGNQASAKRGVGMWHMSIKGGLGQILM
jgi:hypothetical protein